MPKKRAQEVEEEVEEEDDYDQEGDYDEEDDYDQDGDYDEEDDYDQEDDYDEEVVSVRKGKRSKETSSSSKNASKKGKSVKATVKDGKDGGAGKSGKRGTENAKTAKAPATQAIPPKLTKQQLEAQEQAREQLVTRLHGLQRVLADYQHPLQLNRIRDSLARWCYQNALFREESEKNNDVLVFRATFDLVQEHESHILPKILKYLIFQHRCMNKLPDNPLPGMLYTLNKLSSEIHFLEEKYSKSRQKLVGSGAKPVRFTDADRNKLKRLSTELDKLHHEFEGARERIRVPQDLISAVVKRRTNYLYSNSTRPPRGFTLLDQISAAQYVLDDIRKFYPSSQQYFYFDTTPITDDKLRSKAHTPLIFPSIEHEEEYIAMKQRKIETQSQLPPEMQPEYSIVGFRFHPWAKITIPNTQFRFPLGSSPYYPPPLPKPIEEMAPDEVALNDFWSPLDTFKHSYPSTAWLTHPGELRHLLMLPIVGPPLPPDYLVEADWITSISDTATDTPAVGFGIDPEGQVIEKVMVPWDQAEFLIKNYTKYAPINLSIQNMRAHRYPGIYESKLSYLEVQHEQNIWLDFASRQICAKKGNMVPRAYRQQLNALGAVGDGAPISTTHSFDPSDSSSSRPWFNPASKYPLLLSTLHEITPGILSTQLIHPHPQSLATLRELFKHPAILHSFTKSLRIPQTLLTSHGTSIRSTLQSQHTKQDHLGSCQTQFDTYSNCLNNSGALGQSLCVGQLSLLLSCREAANGDGR